VIPSFSSSSWFSIVVLAYRLITEWKMSVTDKAEWLYLEHAFTFIRFNTHNLILNSVPFRKFEWCYFKRWYDLLKVHFCRNMTQCRLVCSYRSLVSVICFFHQSSPSKNKLKFHSDTYNAPTNSPTVICMYLTLNIPSLARQHCIPSWGPRRTPWFFCNFSTVWCGRLLKLCFLGFW